ncbi:MAG TPA: ATP-grasp domain-containing protein [Gemmatimonadales bacterium]|nr:ATP-grasp domain-containing protein [Gemmatimonadales bacterium]
MNTRPIVLVAGVTARALGRSVLAAGHDVVSVDGFGDRDLIEPAPRPRRHLTIQPFEPLRAAHAAAALHADALVYTSNLENHPAAVERLALGRVLLGNPPTVLAAVRDAEGVQRALGAAGLPVAPVYARAPVATARDARPDLLVKPRRSGGGIGVRRWQHAEPVAEDELLQERVDGMPASLTFAANGAEVTPLGLSRQLVGESAFGADGYKWCGNLLGGPGLDVLEQEDRLLASATAAATVLTRAFGLRGINGIDFIARDGVAVVIEVNPRWTAAVELAERASGASLFATHVAACEGRLEAPPRPSPDAVIGKAVIYATADGTAPDTDAWLADPDVRDVPSSGSALPRGEPICTVFAQGRDAAQCRAVLVDRAARIARATANRSNQPG